MDVLLLAGGTSAEREISLRTGENVAQALRAWDHVVTVCDPRDGLPASATLPRFDVVFLALHGTGGEDGQIQAELEQQNVPYTGSGPEASRIAFHKNLAKERFQAAGLATPAAVEFRVEESIEEIGDRAARLALPWIVKPAAQGSSLGVSKVHEAGELSTAVESVRQFDTLGLIEEAIPGDEWTVALFDAVSFPPIAIESTGEFYSYSAKYEEGASVHRASTAALSEMEKTLISAAREAYQAVGATGLARVDFICDREQNPWLLEINTIPGLTNTSSVPKAAEAFGWSLSELCERMCAAALERHYRNRWQQSDPEEDLSP